MWEVISDRPVRRRKAVRKYGVTKVAIERDGEPKTEKTKTNGMNGLHLSCNDGCHAKHDMVLAITVWQGTDRLRARRGNSTSDKVGSAQFYLSCACQRQRGEKKRHSLCQAQTIGWKWGQGAVKCNFLSSIGESLECRGLWQKSESRTCRYYGVEGTTSKVCETPRELRQSRVADRGTLDLCWPKAPTPDDARLHADKLLGRG